MLATLGFDGLAAFDRLEPEYHTLGAIAKMEDEKTVFALGLYWNWNLER